MVDGAQTASGFESLIEQMSREADIHACDFGFQNRVGLVFPCDGELQQIVIRLSEQLSVLSEPAGRVLYPEIDVCLSVSGEENGLAFYSAVRIFRDAVAFIRFPDLFHSPRLPAVRNKVDESVSDRLEILYLVF